MIHIHCQPETYDTHQSIFMYSSFSLDNSASHVFFASQSGMATLGLKMYDMFRCTEIALAQWLSIFQVQWTPNAQVSRSHSNN